MSQEEESISLTNVIEEISKISQQHFDHLPVSKDVPRLARKFSFLDNNLKEVNFTIDKSKDKLNVVLFELLQKLCKELNSQPITNFTQDIFDLEVNTNIPASCDKFFLTYFGKNHPVIKFLKFCNQSPVIGVLYHVRECLTNHGIEFKDCRGMWFIDFYISKDNSPCIIQRRMEQVFSHSSDKTTLICKYKFEWELIIYFDSLQINKIINVELRLKNLDYNDYKECTDKEREDSERIFKKAFANVSKSQLNIVINGD
ncbi:hypothetical protein ABK040_009680 [Willaertia magna]